MSDDHSMLLKMTAVIGTVYVLYILEFISASHVSKEKSEATELLETSAIAQSQCSDFENGNKRNIVDGCGHHGIVSGIANEPVVMC
ncbi:unnamed protein product, partial [Onchocerca flexuosa]|uniref:Secreted protein n=1 Tax=Onchocerca flexuosa TaxID=387005 RepID=A0A183HWP4_9BILA